MVKRPGSDLVGLWFRFNWEDWRQQTVGLTYAQAGALAELLAWAWREPSASLPDDDQQLAATLRLPMAEWLREYSGPLRSRFKAKNGRLSHPWLTERRGDVEEWLGKKREAAQARWRRGRVAG